MQQVKPIGIEELSRLAPVDEAKVDAMLKRELELLERKVVALDDDPTGVQTVHQISVYTDWTVPSLEEGFRENQRLFFVLTNSRGFTATNTERIHHEIAQNLVTASRNTQKDFILISRSDSTLRGHYPLETRILKEDLERLTGKKIDGEILVPFFQEGGRYTLGNVHYVKEGDKLIPAGMTEFAKDKTFGYISSNLCDYVEEKTRGEFRASDVTCISLEDLRNLNLQKIVDQLMGVTEFGKVIVNAAATVDVKIFAIAFCRAVRAGKEFIFRAAAAITKVLGGVTDRPLLTREELISPGNPNGGIVLIGSHVKKTTEQLEQLKRTEKPVEFLEFHVERVAEKDGLKQEVQAVLSQVEKWIREGKSVVVYTSRKLIVPDTNDRDKILEMSTAISDAVVRVIGDLQEKPSFLVAKGGITSSDVGTKALHVKKANVMGQIRPGIPVWMTGPESKFPYMPYVIFPGNVGDPSTLREVVETLI